MGYEGKPARNGSWSTTMIYSILAKIPSGISSSYPTGHKHLLVRKAYEFEGGDYSWDVLGSFCCGWYHGVGWLEGRERDVTLYVHFVI